MKETKFKQTEIGMIPDDWEVKNIGTTCNVFTGGEVPLKYSKDKNEVFKYPIYSNGRDVYGYYTGFVIGDDSVCISSIGENTGDVFFYKGEFTPVIRLKVVVPKSNKISTKYLYYYLKAHKIDGTKNGGIPNINANDVKVLNFPLPSTLAEQQKIAKALSDVDNVITTLEKLITKKTNLKQGTIQQLLTGKKRLPGFAPAVVESVETPAFKQTEIGEIPEDWEVRELGSITKIVMGQSPDSNCYNTDYKGMVLIQGNADIENRKTIVRFYTSQITKIAKKDDLILTVRAPVGSVAKATFDCCLGRGVCALKTNSEYLYQYLIYIEKQWEKLSTGSTFDSINSNNLSKTLIIYPKSEKERIAISDVLSSMDKEIEELSIKLEKYQNLKTGMMQQLLTGKIRLI